ncbi:hypothetical protein BDQ12DRAFT_438014 [Crucibulum laeve]|uniref:G-patch domain-containing protein n=1 Tax=Crucibulum laeve TaxID=68775 RepID=A0A5C3M9N7_9AGAR|nr:hypothetical protein BDQ12DRAFT_438014 [Crucibulum laeve]
MSIVSRSPSPSNAMEVDTEHTHKYDEYVRGVAREVITVETKIKPSNKGFAMLAKLGWSEGQPLGLSGDGRVDPVPFQIKRDLTGLGKSSQDERMIETTVSQRRELDSERQIKETEDQRRAREELVARKTAVETEITTTLKAFYCSLCDKQFKTVAQYDEHTNSYAHHHKARFKDMQANVRLKPKEEVDKRKEKERKREEKELRKIAAASGIKLPKPPAGSAPIAATIDAAASSSANVELEAKKGGWASTATLQQAGPQTGFKKSGWASVGSSSSAPPPPSEPPKSTGWAPAVSAAAQPPPIPTGTNHHSSSAPAFRASGWTSLDTGSSQPTPPPAPSLPPPPPPPAYESPPPPPPQSGWSGVPSSNISSNPSGGWIQPSHHPLPLPPQVAPPPQSSPNPPTAQPVRSGWKQFQKTGPRRG